MLINEVYKKFQFVDYKKLIPYIQKNCSDILKIYRKADDILLRGVDYSSNAFKSSSPTNRTPLDTDTNFQRLIDNKLKEAGFSALRSNSIFCTGSQGQAINYGYTYLIFPINGFTYTWCPTDDLTNEYDLNSSIWNLAYIYYQNKNLETHISKNVGLQFFYDLKILSPQQFIKKYHFNNKHLLTALNEKYEVYIHGKYVAINYNYNQEYNIVGKL